VTLIWSDRHLILKPSERTHKQTLYLSPMVCSSYKKGSGHSFAFPNTCFSTCLVVSSVVQLVSDFVSTPYVLRQRHGVKVIPPRVTCVMLMISKMSSVSFSTAPIPTWFLYAKKKHLCFPQQEPTMCYFLSHNKRCFFLHELIALYEQSHFLTEVIYINLINLVGRV
jgi:hypothetical protein